MTVAALQQAVRPGFSHDRVGHRECLADPQQLHEGLCGIRRASDGGEDLVECLVEPAVAGDPRGGRLRVLAQQQIEGGGLEDGSVGGWGPDGRSRAGDADEHDGCLRESSAQLVTFESLRGGDRSVGGIELDHHARPISSELSRAEAREQLGDGDGRGRRHGCTI